MAEKTTRIRELNDAFRTSLAGGKVYVSDGVNGEGADFVGKALAAVRAFNAFTNDVIGSVKVTRAATRI